MILSDGALETILRVPPDESPVMSPLPERDDIQPASVDVHLGDTIELTVAGGYRTIHLSKDPKQPWWLRQRMHPEDWWGEKWLDMPAEMSIHDPLPDNLVLATTKAVFSIPDHLVGVLDGVSTLARQGLAVHLTAGFIDPGFCGEITLEMTVAGPRKIGLYSGMRIGQLRFHLLDQPAVRPYGHPGRKSKYQGQRGPTLAR